MFRYQVIEMSRDDEKALEAGLWEVGRSGWELVQVLPGSLKNPADDARITCFFKRSASEDIGV